MAEEWDAGKADIKVVFEIYRNNIESGISESLAAAEECDIRRSLLNFYEATMWLRSLDAVFTARIPEVEEYSSRTENKMRKEVIPTLAEKIGVCRGG